MFYKRRDTKRADTKMYMQDKGFRVFQVSLFTSFEFLTCVCADVLNTTESLLDFSLGAGAFVIGLSQISSFFSLEFAAPVVQKPKTVVPSTVIKPWHA